MLHRIALLATSTLPVRPVICSELSLEEFCMIDDANAWYDRQVVDGATILNFPLAAVVCQRDGRCFGIYQESVDLNAHCGLTLAEAA